MNNKGFAITTVLYGTLVLFCLLLVSMLGILSAYKNNLDKLINATNGTKDIIKMEKQDITDLNNAPTMGLYCTPTECEYRYPVAEEPSEPNIPA